MLPYSQHCVKCCWYSCLEIACKINVFTATVKMIKTVISANTGSSLFLIKHRTSSLATRGNSFWSTVAAIPVIDIFSCCSGWYIRGLEANGLHGMLVLRRAYPFCSSPDNLYSTLSHLPFSNILMSGTGLCHRRPVSGHRSKILFADMKRNDCGR